MAKNSNIQMISKSMASKNKKSISQEFNHSLNTTAMDEKKYGSEIGASHFSPDYSKQLVKPVKDWKFSFGRYKDIQLQDANPAQLRPWCRWLVTKIAQERPISAAYAKAYLDGKTQPYVCDWTTNAFPFITIGRYKGFPVNLVSIEHPDYFRWLLQSDLSSQLSNSFKDYLDQNGFIKK